MHDQSNGSDSIRRARSEEVGAILDEVVFAPALTRVARAREMRQLYWQAMEPVRRAIEEDAGAQEAGRKYGEMVAVDHAARRASFASARPFAGAGGSPPFNVKPGVTVFRPPFDYQRTSKDGDGVTASADPRDGTLSVFVKPDEHFDGASSGYAAIGLGLEARKAGNVSIRPMVWYWTAGDALGHFLSATSAGHIGYVVEDEGGRAVSNPPQDVELWNVMHQHWDYTPSVTGWIGDWEYEIHFRAEASHRYTVWFWAKVFGDQSGTDYWFASSTWAGIIQAEVNWVAVELT